MARVIEQVIAVKISRIVKDSDQQEMVLTDEQLSTLIASIPDLAESIVDEPGLVVEVIPVE
jgi:hypothetical protein